MKSRSVVFVMMLGWMSVSALGQTIIYTFEGTAQVSPIDNDGFDGAGLVGAAVSITIGADASASPIDITDPIDVLFSILDAELTIAGSVGGVADGTFPVLELDELHLFNDFVRPTEMIIDALAIGGLPLFQITPDSIVTAVGGIFPDSTWNTNLSLPTDFGVDPITLDLVTSGTDGFDFYRLEGGSATVFISQDATNLVIAEVEAFVDGGTLTEGQGEGVIAKLESALGSLGRGNSTPACKKLRAFINQVNAYINTGALSPDEGQELINSAEDFRDQIGCLRP